MARFDPAGGVLSEMGIYRQSPIADLNYARQTCAELLLTAIPSQLIIAALGPHPSPQGASHTECVPRFSCCVHHNGEPIEKVRTSRPSTFAPGENQKGQHGKTWVAKNDRRGVNV